MGKQGLTVPKWVLIVQLKIPQVPQNLSANLSDEAQKYWISMKKKVSLGVRSPCCRVLYYVHIMYSECLFILNV